MQVREARHDDELAVRNIVDGAALRIGVDDLSGAIAAGNVLVAVESERILGALVLDGTEIASIAVRRGRRDQGIGRSLLRSAQERRDSLSARFEEAVHPFWDAVGFSVVEQTEDGRYRAEWGGTES